MHIYNLEIYLIVKNLLCKMLQIFNYEKNY